MSQGVRAGIDRQHGVGNLGVNSEALRHRGPDPAPMTAAALASPRAIPITSGMPRSCAADKVTMRSVSRVGTSCPLAPK